MSRVAAALLTVCLGAALAGCSEGGSSQPADYRGDPLCESAVVTSFRTECYLSATMHGHTYLLSCDLSQGMCDCARDGGRIPGSYAFGGTVTPTCTPDFLDFAWSDCCGTPEAIGP